MQRSHRHHQHHRGAIGIGDDALVPEGCVVVDVGYHQRHVVLHTERRGVVDDDGPGVGETGSVLTAPIPTSREEGYVYSGRVRFGQILNLNGTVPGLDDGSGRALRCHEPQLTRRERALGEDVTHHPADGSGGSNDGNGQVAHVVASAGK